MYQRDLNEAIQSGNRVARRRTLSCWFARSVVVLGLDWVPTRTIDGFAMGQAPQEEVNRENEEVKKAVFRLKELSALA